MGHGRGFPRSVVRRDRLTRLVVLGVTASLATSVLISGAGLAAGQPTRVAKTDPGITKDEIVIGWLVPQTGPAANILKNAIPAFEAYSAEVNDGGGINKRQLVVQVEDGGTLDATLATVATTKLRDEAFIVAGNDGTISAPLADRLKVPTFYFNGTQKEGLHSKYAFPIGTYHKHQAEVLLPQYLLNELDAKGKKIAVMYEATTFLGEASTAFLKAAKKKGLDVVAEQPIDPLQPQCAQEVSNVAAEKPDIVVSFLLSGSLCVFREAKAQGLQTTWAGIGATYGVDLFLKIVPGLLEGSTLLGIYPTLESACGQEYQEIMRKHLPDNPGILTDQVAFFSYLGTRHMVMQLENAGRKLTRESLVKKLSKEKNFDDGCLPPVSYGPGDKRQGAVSTNVWVAEGDVWITKDPKYHTSF